MYELKISSNNGCTMDARVAEKDMYELKISSDFGLELFKGDDGDFVIEGVLVLGPLARASVTYRPSSSSG
jgi:hypothetical protein